MKKNTGLQKEKFLLLQEDQEEDREALASKSYIASIHEARNQIKHGDVKSYEEVFSGKKK